MSDNPPPSLSSSSSSSSSSTPTVIAAGEPLPSLPLATSSAPVTAVAASTDDESYVLLDDSDQAAHTPSAAVVASLTTSPCSPMVMVGPQTPSPPSQVPLLSLPSKSSSTPSTGSLSPTVGAANSEVSSSQASSTETNNTLSSSPICPPSRSLRVTPPASVPSSSSSVATSSSSPLSGTINSPGGHNNEPGHPQSSSSFSSSHHLGLRGRGSSGWAHDDDNDNDDEDENDDANTNDNDDYDDISDDYHELRSRNRHGHHGGDQGNKTHACDDNDDEKDDEGDNGNGDANGNDNGAGDVDNNEQVGNEYGAEFFRSVLIYAIIFMLAAFTTSRLVGSRGMPSVTIVKLLNGKQMNDSNDVIYTNTRPLSLMARVSPATDTQAVTYEWRYQQQSDNDTYLPTMVGWNSQTLQLPDGLQAGQRSFVVRITRGAATATVASKKKKSGDSVEVTATLNVARSIVMGIDLGTTYGCMAYVNDDNLDNIHVVPVPLDHEHICMPMTIAFHSPSSFALMNASSSMAAMSSMSSVSSSPILMGMAAKKLASLIPDRVFRDLKRIIGRSPAEKTVREFQAKMPFTVTDCNQQSHSHGQLPYDSPCIRVNMSRSLAPLLSPLMTSIQSNGHSNGVDDIMALSLLPEQVLSLIMMRMKLAAAAYTSQDVTDCVITVPAQWNNGQRKATLDAAILAGWNVIKVINEPTSAAFAYGMLSGYDRRAVTHRVLVFDWGGGTVDVSLVTILSSGAYKVQSTNGNMTLGGEDIDARIAHHLLDLFLVRYGVDLRTPQRVGERAHVLYEAERAKRALSHHESYNVGVPVDSRLLEIVITRQQMEVWCSDLFESAMIPVAQVLHDAYSFKYVDSLAKLGSDDALTVLMVGGSSYIPKVKTMLSNLFPSGTKIYLPNNDTSTNDASHPSSQLTPELAVVYGAALAGKRLNDLRHAGLGQNPEEGSSSSFLMDITPMPLGVKIYAQKDGTDYQPLIKRNELYPVEQSGSFQSVFDYQRTATINVYEGESNRTCDNHFVGRFEVKLPLLPQGQARVLIAYKIDGNGILTVTATSGIDNKSHQMQVYSQDGRIPRSMLVSLRDASNIMLTYTNRDTDIMMMPSSSTHNGNNEGIMISTSDGHKRVDAYESYSSSSTILPLSTPPPTQPQPAQAQHA